MAAGPCLNPNCKSHGKPHPNCHCYDGIGEHGMGANGGPVVGHFCDIKQMHKPGCEYYKDGGSVDAPPSYEDTQPMQASQNEAPPKYEDTHAMDAAPKYEDTEPLAPPKYDDSHPAPTPGHTFAMSAGNSALLGLGSAANGVMNAAKTIVGDKEHGSNFNGADIKAAYNKGFQDTEDELKAGKETNPNANLAGNIVGTVASPVNFIPFASPVAKVAVQAGAFATGDELHDYLSGDKNVQNMNDLKVSAYHIAGSAALGMLLGKGEKFVGDVASNFTNKASQFAEGVGASAHDLTPDQLAQLSTAARAGYKIFKSLPKLAEDKLVQRAVGAAAGVASGTGPLGVAVGDRVADAAHNAIQPFIERNITPFMDKATRKVLAPVLIKALQNESIASLPQAVGYAARAQQGRSLLNKSVMAVFDKTPAMSQIADKSVDELDKYIKAGGINPSIKATIQEDNDQPEPYAKGGMVDKKTPVQKDPKSLDTGLQKTYPEQHLLNVQAKTRLSNYLQSQMPTQPTGAPMFDSDHKDATAERKYKRALHAAINPMRFLEHAKNGTLLAEHLQHMNAMYPEVLDATKEQLTKHLLDMKLKGEKPPLKLRQSLSLILGTSLDASTLPMNIMAAQATFAPKQAPGQKQVRNTSKLDKVPKDDITASQAGTARRQGSKN